MFIDCKNEEQNIIEIETSVTVESAETNQNIIDALFDEDSQFIDSSAKLLSELFGIPITFDVYQIDDVNVSVSRGISKRIVAIIEFSLYIICIVLLFVMRARIGIGFYDQEHKSPEINGFLSDLDQGIRLDIRNANEFFGKTLNYDVFPDYNQSNKNTHRANWEKHELLQFLRAKATDLENNIKKYDSCHGIEHHILTSDYKKVSKSEIHRIFAVSGKIRKIPRIFLFDCCAGGKEQDYETRLTIDEEKKWQYDKDVKERQRHSEGAEYAEVTSNDKNKSVQSELQKNASMKKMVHQESAVWALDEVNPDFRLCVFSSSNEGYQSKMNTASGSYVVTEFIERMSTNIEYKSVDSVESDTTVKVM